MLLLRFTNMFQSKQLSCVSSISPFKIETKFTLNIVFVTMEGDTPGAIRMLLEHTTLTSFEFCGKNFSSVAPSLSQNTSLTSLSFVATDQDIGKEKFFFEFLNKNTKLTKLTIAPMYYSEMIVNTLCSYKSLTTLHFECIRFKI